MARKIDTIEHDIDSRKTLAAFQETIADRQRVAQEGEDIHPVAPSPSPEQSVESAESVPALKSESVAAEFLALTRAHQTQALETKPARKPFHVQHRRGPNLKR